MGRLECNKNGPRNNCVYFPVQKNIQRPTAYMQFLLKKRLRLCSLVVLAVIIYDDELRFF